MKLEYDLVYSRGLGAVACDPSGSSLVTLAVRNADGPFRSMVRSGLEVVPLGY